MAAFCVCWRYKVRRFSEAVQLFKAERKRMPLEERADAVESFMSSVLACDRLSEEHSLWVRAELQVQLAQTFAEWLGTVKAERAGAGSG